MNDRKIDCKKDCAALILAAGKGVRMRSRLPKTLCPLLGSPMLAYVLAALKPIFGERTLIVAGHMAQFLRDAFPREKFVIQERQLGTGDALKSSMPELRRLEISTVVVVNGDTPLLTAEVTEKFLAGAAGADAAFASLTLKDPAAYGRVARKNGKVLGIIEAAEYDESQYGPVTGEVNGGLYLFKMEFLDKLLPLLTNANKSGEYFLTDLIALGVESGYDVRAVDCGDDPALMGVNSPAELVAMEEILREKTARKLLESGVTLRSPQSTRVSPFATAEPGAEISGPCEVYGGCVIRAGARIEPFCILRDSVAEAGSLIRSFSHLEGARVGPGAVVGPYARLRPGATLERDSRAGNFVELKKTRLGPGAKANHLTYLGDTDVGAGANIGAGTITCNFDGEEKHRTQIGEKAFIGSNVALVAPVNIGAEALVGAGSTITKDVPDGEMGIARSKQKNLRRRR